MLLNLDCKMKKFSDFFAECSKKSKPMEKEPVENADLSLIRTLQNCMISEMAYRRAIAVDSLLLSDDWWSIYTLCGNIQPWMQKDNTLYFWNSFWALAPKRPPVVGQKGPLKFSLDWTLLVSIKKSLSQKKP